MKKSAFFILLIFNLVFFTKAIYSQTKISGVINHYSFVDSVYPTKDTLLVIDPTNFSAGDTIMVYQMKGAILRTDTSNNENNFGTVFGGQIQNAGKYEIVIIEGKNGNEIILRNDLINTYNTDHLVQIIRVPSYKNVLVENEVTCDPWDGEKGGVLVLMVNDTISLDANLSVVGKGFRGGQAVLGSGNCSSTDSALYRSIYFDNTFAGAGEKGEGIALYSDTYAKGFGAWANGGGGGNGRFAGGGGGSNSASGGLGGGEDSVTCSTPDFIGEIEFDGDTADWFGLGGRGGQRLSTNSYINDSTIFLGGGGGSGTMTASISAENGGNGGGIIIIIAKVIKSNGNEINANGATPTASQASGGGGGGGGTIVFDVDSVNGSLDLHLKGGDGGNVATGYVAGPGGGGGGGALLYGRLFPSNYENVGGEPGVLEGELPTIVTNNALKGNTGFVVPSIKVPLNGFLFNSISAKQEVCSGEKITIHGSNPRGGYGEGTYTYKWIRSNDGINWNDTIVGETGINYITPALTDTIYYKRIVTSGDIIDPGIILKINVQTVIVGNSITGDDLITCIGNPADTVLGSRVVIGGNSEYEYVWQYKWDAGTWTNIEEHDDTICWPGEVQDTTFIRRVVISGACYDTTYLSNEITGLPQITNNIISEEQEICDGDTPEQLTGLDPENGLGSGSYLYLWQKRTKIETWTDISGATEKNYQPTVLFDTTYYRRIVFSDDCIDESDSIMIGSLPVISNNIIENDLPIFTCYNTNPEELLGSVPEGGNSMYNYQWQDSIQGGSWTNIAESATDTNYSPVAITDTTFYRRIVTSSACSDASIPVKINIWDLPLASIATVVDTICSGDDVFLEFSFTEIGKFPMNLTYNNGVDDFVKTVNNSGIYNVTENPTTEEHDSTYQYTIVQIVDDNGCIATSKDGLTTIEVYGNPTTYAGTDVEECSHQYILQAEESLGIGTWSKINGQGTATFDTENNKNAIASVDISDRYTFQWKETNWECSDSDRVEVYYYQQIDSVIVGKDTVLNYETEYTLIGDCVDPDKELNLDVNLSCNWEEITDIVIVSDELQNGKNLELSNLSSYYGSIIKYQLAVTKGVCDPISNEVTITINDIFVPENVGFTPNGDGIHDYLQFDGLERAESNELIIYNRWGAEVFRQSNFSNNPGWDGRNNDGNELPDDTYYFILNHTKKNGENEIDKGYIVIKR